MTSTTCLVITVKQPGIGRREEWTGRRKEGIRWDWKGR
jgi:hypothetical protein